jgi:hypothetical protein
MLHVMPMSITQMTDIRNLILRLFKKLWKFFQIIIVNKAKVIEMSNKQLRDEETTPSHNCFKKLTEDFIEKYILDLPEFGQFLTAKDPIELYKALQNEYPVVTHDDIMRDENSLNDTVERN